MSQYSVKVVHRETGEESSKTVSAETPDAAQRAASDDTHVAGEATLLPPDKQFAVDLVGPLLRPLRPLRVVGILLTAIGAVIVVLAVGMDTTVYDDSFTNRLHNTGKMQTQTISMLLGMLMAGVGFLTLVLSEIAHVIGVAIAGIADATKRV